ncbi:MAG: hypothetical protein ABI721_03730 [Candidatus Dojkabacteria bacterium]
MNKKFLLLIMIIPLVILITASGALFLLYQLGKNNLLDVVNNQSNVSYPVQTNNVISYPISNTINYTHPSGRFSYKYPDSWEFVPKREDMGLRPKVYGGFSKNEIVTVLYFEGKGADLKAWASVYDGGNPWESITINNNNGIFYKYSSEHIKYDTYWFSDGQNAVKIMFTLFDAYPTDGHYDNSQYEADFNIILNSFHFN